METVSAEIEYFFDCRGRQATAIFLENGIDGCHFNLEYL
jgi:hypothetical protein